ncbi:hypothetical protein LCGC14_1681140 [marine sediment metagenome]|uniref:Helicase ATP-binding domain-containing protein n=1 Tax=marine sediment metagenome TaxID=412755 RepID=A0A0F9HP04_9ZZZZ
MHPNKTLLPQQSSCIDSPPNFYTMLKNETEEMKYIRVMLNLPLRQSFVYKVPPEFSSQLKIGTKILVPFGRQVLSGFAIEEARGKQNRKDLKEIIKIFNDFPPLSDSLIKLGKWISDYYHCSLGQALHSIFPIQETFRIKKDKEGQKKIPAVQKLTKLSSLTRKYGKNVSLPEKKKGVFLLRTGDNNKSNFFYLSLIEQTLKEEKQVILITPEISHITYLQELIHSHYRGDIAILHSRLSARQRYEELYKIGRGDVCLAIGTRSATFAPFPRLGLIIIEEEENPAYKQMEAPRYHVREVAIKRGKIENFPVVLATGSPSLESWYRAKKGVYETIGFYQGNKSPYISIIDMRKEKDRILSSVLEEGIKKNLEENKSTLLFLNRRGFAKFLLCLDCGKVLYCPNCNISLTFHLQGKLVCHYCDYQEKAPRVCPSCKGRYFRRTGLGTEQLEIEVKKRFSKAYVRRGDLDVIKSSLLYKKLRSDLTEKKINILVGTQLIIKEEILSHMNLVGIVIADGLLNLPDFRAGEYLFHLLNKIRRSMKPQGRLVIQTYNPTHYAMEALKKEKEDNFYRIESGIRRDLGYPPYLHWTRILLEGRVKTKIEKVAESMRESLEKEEIEFLGPSSCPFAKIRGKYRYHMILKNENLSYIRKILDEKLSPLFNGIQGIRGIVDVDPLQTM